MKGHIFIKTNDKLGRAAERAPDNVLHTTAQKNATKISMAIYVRGTYSQTQLFYWLIIVGLQQHVSALFLGHHQVVSRPSVGYTTCYLLPTIINQ